MQKLSKLLVLTLIFTSCNSIKKPIVVIFLTDDQGTLDANCFGSKHLITPNIDKLASTGVSGWCILRNPLEPGADQS